MTFLYEKLPLNFNNIYIFAHLFIHTLYKQVVESFDVFEDH